jgi:6-pyruvoyltetrahydropterin/6-carboxytetrahydropterin synthase
MRAYFSRRYRFSASHRLHTDALSDAENAEVYGKCNNPYGHGHNYIVEVTVGGQVDPSTGMVVNLVDLDRFVGTEILDRYDHTNLNLLDDFRDLVPTTENLCIRIYHRLAGAIGSATLVRVRIEETSNNFFEYAGEGN